MYLHALHLLLLAPFTLSIGVPNCIRPAPPPDSIPTTADCNALLDFIEAVARVQHNTPFTWSRHPPRIAGRELPAYFSGAGNDCEFVADVKGGREAEDEEDVFPTGDLVFIGRYIVETCLVGEAGAEGTIGSDAVGPREVVELRLRKKEVVWTAGGALDLLDGTLLELNGTAGARVMSELEKAENVSGIA